MAKNKIIQIDNGDSISFGNKQVFWFTCCDCNLTHRMETTVIKGRADLRITRDERRTSQKRRRAREKKK